MNAEVHPPYKDMSICNTQPALAVPLSRFAARVRLICLLLVSGVAAAQCRSGNAGWCLDDSLQLLDAAVIGDIMGATAILGDPNVTVRTTVRVVRVLTGELRPGADVALEWQYMPSPVESRAVASRPPTGRAMWLLRRGEGGRWRALRISGIAPRGGMFLKLADDAPPSPPLAYGPEAPLQGKLAQEAGWALRELAVRRAADLATKTAPTPPEPLSESAQTRLEFDALSAFLLGLDRTARTPVFQDLSWMDNAHLKMLGITGRIGAGDASALLDLERDLPRLAATPESTVLLNSVSTLDLSQNLAAAHALGRMALAENTVPGLDALFANQVGSTRSLEFLAYLPPLMHSPEGTVRASAAQAFCLLLEPAGDVWQPEMAARCPRTVPFANPAEEGEALQFWANWWEAHRVAIQELVKVPEIAAPDRYASHPARGVPNDVAKAIRFQVLLDMVLTSDAPDSRSDIGPPSGVPVYGAQRPLATMLNASDKDMFLELAGGIRSQLDKNEQRARDLIDAARATRGLPEQDQLSQLESQRMQILKSGLQEIHNHLSAEGWDALEVFMMAIHIRDGAISQRPRQR